MIYQDLRDVVSTERQCIYQKSFSVNCFGSFAAEQILCCVSVI